MKRWHSFLTIAGASAGILAGSIIAAAPADAQPYPYYRHDAPPPAVRHRIEEHRIERQRAIAHREWVAAHWENDRYGHRVWRPGYWR